MKTRLTLAIVAGTLIATPALAAPQTMDPNMPGMTGMQDHAKPTEAQGVGIVRAIDTDKDTVTLQHDAITSIGWPAMTMTFKVVPPDLLKGVKVGDKVRFTLRPAGMASTVTAIKPMQP